MDLLTDIFERYLGSDPGHERFRTALKTAVAAAAAIGVAALLESVTHGFEGADVTNHFARLIVLMLGSTTALVATFVGSEGNVRTRAVTSLITAVGLWAGVAVGIAVHGIRPIALILLVVIPSAGAWFRRYGARGFAAGFPVHVGYLIGFLLGSTVGVDRLGWIAAVIGLAGLATFAVGVAFMPWDARATARMLRSYRALAQRVLALIGDVTDAEDPHVAERPARRLRQQLVALNEAALLLDVAFAQEAPAEDDHATSERRRALFEHEHALAMLARLAQRGAKGTSPTAAASALEATMTHGGDEASPPAVRLIGGWLPGSAAVNAAASSRPATSRFDVALSVSTRAAVQLSAALTLAVVFGDLVSSSHLLWAVVAVYVTFLGSTSDREQLRKALYRVAGTIGGVVVGDVVAHLTDLRTVPTLIVVLLAIFFMAYFARVHYALVVFAVTVGVAQFYAQAGELSTSLLATRVEETVIGAACAIAVGLAVIPLRTAKSAQVALAGYLQALAQLLENLTGERRPGGRGPWGDTRALDASFHAAAATISPLTRTFLGGINPRCMQVLRLVDLSHDLGRTAVDDNDALDRTRVGPVALRAASIARAIATDLEQAKAARVLRSPPIETDEQRQPMRGSAGLYSELEDIEGALVALAAIRGVPIPDPGLN